MANFEEQETAPVGQELSARCTHVLVGGKWIEIEYMEKSRGTCDEIDGWDGPVYFFREAHTLSVYHCPASAIQGVKVDG